MTQPLKPGGAVGSERLFALRELLTAVGYSPGTSKSYTGKLVSEVRRFQAQHMLTVDGVIGPQTMEALGRVASGREPYGFSIAEPILCGQVSSSEVVQGLSSERARLILIALVDRLAGVREVPLGSNRVPGLEPRAQGKPWCDFQVHAWIRGVRGYWLFGGRRGSTRVSWAQAKKRELTRTDGPLPGDIALVLDDNGVPKHTYLIVRVCWQAHSGWVQTLEGNSNNRVAMRNRPLPSPGEYYDPFNNTPEERAEIRAGMSTEPLPEVTRGAGGSTR